jgi:ribosomal protein L19
MKTEEIIKSIEAEYLKSDLPIIHVGDTIRVGVRIVEGDKERIQPYEGIVIAKRHGGINETITVRKVLPGCGSRKSSSCSTRRGLPVSRSSVVVKYVGRNSTICAIGLAKPPGYKNVSIALSKKFPATA